MTPADIVTFGAYLLAILLGIVVIWLAVCEWILTREERDDRATGAKRRLIAEIARHDDGSAV